MSGLRAGFGLGIGLNIVVWQPPTHLSDQTLQGLGPDRFSLALPLLQQVLERPIGEFRPILHQLFGHIQLLGGTVSLGTDLGLRLGLELEEVFMFDSNSENRDKAVEAVEAVESVSEARAVF